jgi:hypothetical protein
MPLWISLKARSTPGPGARDVAGVAQELRPAVDQQHASVARRALAGVVQRRAVRVERHDRRVGQLVLLAADAGEELLVDLELGGALEERGARGVVPQAAQARGLVHAGDLVGALHGAIPVEARQQRGGIAVRGGDAPLLRGRGRVADVGGLARERELLPGRGLVSHFLELELRQPERIADRQLLVPVVLGLHAHEQRLLAGADAEQVLRPVERDPVREVRRRLEGRVLVVGVVGEGHAGLDHQRVVARGRERRLGLRLALLDVGGEELDVQVDHLT